MKTNHTPGPWSLGSMSWDVVVSNHEDWRNSMICKVASGEDKKQEFANARLIAAAPELLEACKSVVGLVEACHEVPPTRANALKAAIAKAEGQ